MEKNDSFTFLVFNKEQYIFLNNKNVVLFESKKQSRQIGFVNKLFDKYDYVIFHGLCAPFHFLKVKRKNLRKIVWRTWGGDVGYQIQGGAIKSFIKRIINRMFFSRANKIALIGYANLVDLYNLSSNNLTVKKLSMPYSVGDGYSVLKQEELIPIKKSSVLRILVGHSGHLEDNHLKILTYLAHLKGNGIQIIMPLSYGNEEYIRLIEEKASNIFSKKEIVFLKQPLKYETYVHLVHCVDIAFLDGLISYALGNISILLHFRKKIFLNKSGILAKVFYENSIPFFDTESVKNMGLDELREPACYKESKLQNFAVPSNALCLKRIEDVKDYLKRANRR